MSRHVRIDIDDSALAPRLFADFYLARTHPAGRPILCFWGGAISAEEYERRRISTPDLIVRHWLGAAPDPASRPDLLVFSLPDVEPCTTLLLRSRLRRAFAEVVAATPNPWTSAIGYVGHSAGACLAACLAFDFHRSRALATLGGVGMAGALADTVHPSMSRLAIASFANNGDPCRGHTIAFARSAAARRARIPVHTAPGGHDFLDYAANGSAGAAFAFVIEHLMAYRSLRVSRDMGERRVSTHR